jgi:hypothetical protein
MDITSGGVAGGWTLITSLSATTSVTSVNNQTQITPMSTNLTNRGMRLPGVREVLIVTDGRDTGFDTAFDKWEVYSGVTNLRNDLTTNNLTDWQSFLDALNMNTGRAWSRAGTTTGVDETWQFTAQRVNDNTNFPGSCLQTPLRGAYGDGNYGGANSASSPASINSIGAIWHHWVNETWFSGATTSNSLRCNQTARNFTNWTRTVYLR